MAEPVPAGFRALGFREQSEFLLGKVAIPTRGWTDIWRDQHDTSFIVSGAYKADLVTSLKQATEKAVLEHGSLDKFRSEFDEIVNRTGWTYNGTREWRTRLIFETNMRASYQAGRFAQLTEPAFLAANPYWRYKHSDAVKHPRPQHKAWDGLVIAANDGWWQSHYPPNGWGCQCTVFAENDRSLKRRGRGISQPPQDGFETVTVGQRSGNPRTVTVPNGIDPGWDYPPGAKRAQEVREAVQAGAQKLPQQLQLGLKQSINNIPPAPPAPVAAPAPPGPTNTLRPVSDALTLPRETSAAPVRRALQIVDSVHDDGLLPKIRVRMIDPGKVYGEYTYHPPTDVALRISISRGSPHPELTLAHELGHFLDHQVIGGRGFDYSGAIWADWVAAVDASRAVKQLKAQAPSAYSRYLLEREELWARSYAQYIAETSADPRMLAQLTSMLNQRSYPAKLVQWEGADFAPIRAAIDGMFRRLGWLK